LDDAPFGRRRFAFRFRPPSPAFVPLFAALVSGRGAMPKPVRFVGPGRDATSVAARAIEALLAKKN
jgi:hypothetical protein